jgi:general secretion pathway protein H
MGWKAVTAIMRILPPGERNREDAGFSLLELIVVLILIGAAAAMVAPSFTGSIKNLELETSARDLITQMRHARSEAIGRQKVYRVVLDRDGENAFYYLANDFGEEISRVPLASEIRWGIEEQELPLVVSFYPNGRSSGTRFSVRNRQKEMWIELNRITGFAKVVPDGERSGR